VDSIQDLKLQDVTKLRQKIMQRQYAKLWTQMESVITPNAELI